MDPRGPTMQHLSVLPWDSATSWINFLTIFRSWDVDTNGRNGTTSWYKRSTYRLYQNLVQNFKQPKITRILLAKWRAKSADKRKCSDEDGLNKIVSATTNVPNRFSEDEDDDHASAVVDMLRSAHGADIQSLNNLSRSDLLRMKSNSYLDDKTDTLREITNILQYDSDGLERKPLYDESVASG